MLEFLIDSIFAMFGGRVFQQTVGIPMGTNCAPLLADLFLYSYEADFIQGLLKKSDKKLVRFCNCTFLYIQMMSFHQIILSLVIFVYPIELEINDTTDTARYASYLDLHAEIDSEGWLRTTDFHCLTLLFNYVVLYAFHSIEQSSKLIPAALNSLLPM